MPGKNKSRRNRNRGRNRGNRGGGGNNDDLYKELALLGVVPDMFMDRAQLTKQRDLALLALPGRPGDKRLTGFVEIFAAALVSAGFSQSDAAEAIQLLAGSGLALHWSEIMDFDPSVENAGEKLAARNFGGRFAAAYEAASALRKKVAPAKAAELKKAAAYRSGFPGFQ